MPKIDIIEGTITTADGQKRSFMIATDGGWQQWGNTTEHLGHTSEALEVIARALLEEDLLGSAEDEEPS